MKFKKNKSEISYCIHYDLRRLNRPQLTKEDIENKGKTQYEIKVKYFLYHGNVLADSNSIRVARIRVGLDKLFKKKNTIENNIVKTKKIFIDELKRAGITNENLTNILKIKGFGCERR